MPLAGSITNICPFLPFGQAFRERSISSSGTNPQARQQGRGHPLPLFDLMPGAAGTPESDLSDRDRFILTISGKALRSGAAARPCLWQHRFVARRPNRGFLPDASDIGQRECNDRGRLMPQSLPTSIRTTPRGSSAFMAVSICSSASSGLVLTLSHRGHGSCVGVRGRAAHSFDRT